VPPRAWRQRVLDIINAAERILALTRDIDFDRFTSDPVLHDAVLYSPVVIGEAARYVPAEVRSRHSSVPWRDMREMRNFVAHVYHGVSDRRVWKTITRDLPLLIPSLRQILADEPQDDADE
jgi:uncharacterized protein with HEPN domain